MKWATATGDSRVNSEDSRSLRLAALFRSRRSPTASLPATARALASSLCFPRGPSQDHPLPSQCVKAAISTFPRGNHGTLGQQGYLSSWFYFLMDQIQDLNIYRMLQAKTATRVSESINCIALNAKNGYKGFSKIPTSNHAERPRDKHFVKLTWNSQIISLNQDATAGVLDIDWLLIIVPLK